jgi:hypothetical protein
MGRFRKNHTWSAKQRGTRVSGGWLHGAFAYYLLYYLRNFSPGGPESKLFCYMQPMEAARSLSPTAPRAHMHGAELES